jgi:hypothetical protein
VLSEQPRAWGIARGFSKKGADRAEHFIAMTSL